MYKFLEPDERKNLLLELRKERNRKQAERIKTILLLDEGTIFREMMNKYC